MARALLSAPCENPSAHKKLYPSARASWDNPVMQFLRALPAQQLSILAFSLPPVWQNILNHGLLHRLHILFQGFQQSRVRPRVSFGETATTSTLRLAILFAGAGRLGSRACDRHTTAAAMIRNQNALCCSEPLDLSQLPVFELGNVLCSPLHFVRMGFGVLTRGGESMPCLPEAWGSKVFLFENPQP